MTMLKPHKDLLPAYLDGPNIRKHCEVLDRQFRKLHSSIDLTSLMFDLERPVLFGSGSVVVHSRAPIRKVTLQQGGTVEFVSYDYDALVTDVTYNVSEFQSLSSFDFCRVETFDDVTYEKGRTEHDPFLDNLGVLCGVPRKSDETDLQHQSRVRYFCEHYGEMDLALLMLYLLYDISPNTAYVSNHQQVIMDWGITNMDEIQQFSDKYCPITRPLKIVSRLHLASFTSNEFTFPPDYPTEMIRDVDYYFYNVTAGKMGNLMFYMGSNKLEVTNTGLLDYGTNHYPVKCAILMYYNQGSVHYNYLCLFLSSRESDTIFKEYYDDEIGDKAYAIMNDGIILDTWFDGTPTSTVLSADRSSVSGSQTVTFTAIIKDSSGNYFTDGRACLICDDNIEEGAYVTGENITWTVTPPEGDSKWWVEFEQDNGEHLPSSSDVINITNTDKQSSSITTNSDSLTLYYGTTGTITGTYKVENTGTSGATIKLKAGNTLLDTTTTGSGGAFSFTYTANDWSLSGTNLTLLVEETSTVSSASKNIALTLQRHTTTLSVADVTASVGDTVDIVVYATDENGDPVSEGTVTVEITPQSNNS